MSDLELALGHAELASLGGSRGEDLQRVEVALDAIRHTLVTLSNRITAIDDRTAADAFRPAGDQKAPARTFAEAGLLTDVIDSLNEARVRRNEIAEDIGKELFVTTKRLGEQADATVESAHRLEDRVGSMQAQLASLHTQLAEVAARDPMAAIAPAIDALAGATQRIEELLAGLHVRSDHAAAGLAELRTDLEGAHAGLGARLDEIARMPNPSDVVTSEVTPRLEEAADATRALDKTLRELGVQFARKTVRLSEQADERALATAREIAQRVDRLDKTMRALAHVRAITDERARDFELVEILAASLAGLSKRKQRAVLAQLRETLAARARAMAAQNVALPEPPPKPKQTRVPKPAPAATPKPPVPAPTHKPQPARAQRKPPKRKAKSAAPVPIEALITPAEAPAPPPTARPRRRKKPA